MCAAFATALKLSPRVLRYSAYNAVWKHPETGAILYVGNADTAKQKKALDSISVRRIVFCQTSDGQCYHERDPQFKYLKFPIGVWRQVGKLVEAATWRGRATVRRTEAIV